jgi:hypothetical protein
MLMKGTRRSVGCKDLFDVRFRSLFQPQQTFNRYIFVHRFPMNADSATYQSPFFSFFRRSSPQTRKPNQWRGNLAPICQHDSQAVICATDFDGKRLNLDG